MRTPAHTAAAFDRDDPFIFARVTSQARFGIVMHNYDRARRMPAPIEDRFRLGKIRK